MYLRINGLEVKAEQYIGTGHLNVQTVRSEARVHSTDWILTFPGGILTVLPNMTVEGLIAGENLPSTIGEVHAQAVQDGIDGPYVHVEAVRALYISGIEAEKAKIRATYPELKEVFDAIEASVNSAAEQMVARENALKDTTPALKADEDLSAFDGK